MGRYGITGIDMDDIEYANAEDEFNGSEYFNSPTYANVEEEKIVVGVDGHSSPMKAHVLATEPSELRVLETPMRNGKVDSWAVPLAVMEDDYLQVLDV